MRIAIIGSGISGSAAAYALSTSTTHELSVYESDNRLGGHSATVDIEYDGRRIAVDTGFIVYNEMNYPHLTALFAELAVETREADMSFAVSARRGGFEWCGRTYKVVDGLFAQRSNLLSPRYLGMLLEVVRFNKQAVRDDESGFLAALSLAEYLKARKFSDRFRDDYLIPMGAAIWSMSAHSMLAFPAASFVAFFRNHHLLQWNRPVWRTVSGGSRRYVEKIAAPWRDRALVGTGAAHIERSASGVVVTGTDGRAEHFDQVIMAAHSDQSLALLTDAGTAEREILGAIGYRDNAVYLHRDEALMPRRKRAWAAWNVMQGDDPAADLCVTYWMNALQGIDADRPLFVTLNPPQPPDPALTFGRYTYAHPQYDAPAIAAQKRLHEIQGHNRTWFCGAWTRHGFHEDGLASGLAVAEALGGRVSWQNSWTDAAASLAEAAE